MTETLEQLQERISANADSLIAMGYKEWRKRHKRKLKRFITQEDRVRDIEESLIQDKT